jgi:hypothetical protein
MKDRAVFITGAKGGLLSFITRRVHTFVIAGNEGHCWFLGTMLRSRSCRERWNFT